MNRETQDVIRREVETFLNGELFKNSKPTEELLTNCLDRLFSEGGWEIPDDSVYGKCTTRLNAQADRIDSLIKTISDQSKTITDLQRRIERLERKQ